MAGGASSIAGAASLSMKEISTRSAGAKLPSAAARSKRGASATGAGAAAQPANRATLTKARQSFMTGLLHRHGCGEMVGFLAAAAGGQSKLM
jgi:hypothetical protein